MTVPETRTNETKVKKVDLALGGGGAKGFVHVGVIKALVDHGYEIASIVGTSSGALVGSIFAYQRAVWGAGKDVRGPTGRSQWTARPLPRHRLQPV